MKKTFIILLVVVAVVLLLLSCIYLWKEIVLEILGMSI